MRLYASGTLVRLPGKVQEEDVQGSRSAERIGPGGGEESQVAPITATRRKPHSMVSGQSRPITTNKNNNNRNRENRDSDSSRNNNEDSSNDIDGRNNNISSNTNNSSKKRKTKTGATKTGTTITTVSIATMFDNRNHDNNRQQ